MNEQNQILALGRVKEALNADDNYPRLNLKESIFFFMDIVGLTTPEYLNLSGLGLVELPDEIWELKNLKILKLNDNNLTGISNKIGKLRNLVILNLSNNKLTSLPNEIGYLKYLEELDVSNNQISILPEEMENLINLRNHYDRAKIEGSDELATLYSPGIRLEGNPLPGLNGEISSKEPVDIISGIIAIQNAPPPKVFISYSWDNDNHKNWVLNLANRLVTDGVDIILDQYELRLGGNLQFFMEKAVSNAKIVLLMLTENYKLKADNRKGGVGYEYSIISSEMYQNNNENRKFFPILKSGDYQNSIPTFVKAFVSIDFRDEHDFEKNYSALLKEIFDVPTIQKPIIGKRPNWI